ncbi:Protein FAR1-RELATED SEQUENCE like [Quillaja saponaria]|uniref:Protein FAR1-RELATED SEQUENCE n=1 Tax=Quillaja saponaria TaxID=32244 RepID=A0AAD7PRI3_QUISA|nr:Protein FAR1-RELATED SEQUENCE like [Quillaja saponaria]
MDVEVINVEERTGHLAVANNGNAKLSESEVNNVENSGSHNGGGLYEPYVGMEFDSEDAAKTFYDEYARRVGFSIKTIQHSRSKADGGILFWEFVCGREGLKRRYNDNCDAMLRVELKGQDKWVVTKFMKEHSHSMLSSSKLHYLRPHKPFTGPGPAKTMAEVYQGVGLVPSGVMYVSMDRNRASTENNRGIRNAPPAEPGFRNTPHAEPGIRYTPPSEQGIRTVSSAEAGVRNTPPAEPGIRNTPPVEPGLRNTPHAELGIRNTPPAEPNRSVKILKSSTTINYGVRPSMPKRSLGRDAQNLLEYFKKMQAENPGFFYAIQLDEDNRMSNVFWADARSRTAYNHFGDAVTLDTRYSGNQYRVPFAPLTGVNNHGQIILFGCTLLLDDSEGSFVWLFKTFLTAMNDRHPVSIITDQDKAIQTAVSQVFPEARHCVSKWHVLREGHERLAFVCHTQPNFQVELYNCINLTETIEEFESSWHYILDKYDLRKNDWLQSLYNARAEWVPVYFRDSFFAAISPNQGFDISFFNGYVNQQTTLPMFFRLYERALEKSFECEIEADFETIRRMPVLKTPSPMEKQAADLYTRKIFLKFQDELVETFAYTANRIEVDGAISTYRVAKYEDDRKAYTVTFNYSKLRANCSCQMFEYSGILCRHVLTVFTVTTVLTLPSHYILKRWTRKTKSSVGSDDPAGELHGQEYLTSRYNNLCQEAIRYAEEGAIALETYNVATNALREAVKKIQPLCCGHCQDEVSRRFNLNDAGGSAQSVSDMNFPRMTPVSLHRDDGPPENLVVLPCLKSMTWVMENKSSIPGNKVAVINLKLQEYSRTPSLEYEVKFQLSRVTLEPMLRSMAYISEQLSTPANKVAVINLKILREFLLDSV